VSRLISLNDATDSQLRTSVAPPFMWQPASVVSDVISVRVRLLVAAGTWQNSGRTPAAVVFSVMADVIPVLLTVFHHGSWQKMFTKHWHRPITFLISLPANHDC
jgi:hypothetical protein